MVELNGPTDYRLQRIAGMKVYLTPLSPEADAAMDAAWRRLTDCAHGKPINLPVLGRQAGGAAGGARAWRGSTLPDLCAQPLAAADYLAVAQEFHTVLLDHIPVLTPENAQ